MAADPYGFPETVATDTPRAALLSMWLGVAALICGAIGPCLCYMPWFVALPLSIAAVWFGVKAKSGSVDPSMDRGIGAASTAGLVSGGVALLLSILYVGLFVVYVIYMVALGLAFSDSF